MPLSSKDLPPHMKEELLRQLRDQIGWQQYNRLVAQLGEDGLVDAVLQGLGKPDSQPTADRKSKKAGAVAGWVGWVLFGLYIVLLVTLVPRGADAEWAWWHYVLAAPIFILCVLASLGQVLTPLVEYFDWLAKDPAAGCAITIVVVIGVAVVVLVLVLIF